MTLTITVCRGCGLAWESISEACQGIGHDLIVHRVEERGSEMTEQNGGGMESDFWAGSRQITGMIVNLARPIAMMPLDRYIQGYEQALTLGPTLDPSGFIQNRRNVEDALRIVRAARRFLFEINEVVQPQVTRSRNVAESEQNRTSETGEDGV